MRSAAVEDEGQKDSGANSLRASFNQKASAFAESFRFRRLCSNGKLGSKSWQHLI